MISYRDTEVEHDIISRYKKIDIGKGFKLRMQT